MLGRVQRKNTTELGRDIWYYYVMVCDLLLDKDCAYDFIIWLDPHSNHVNSSKWVDTLICHTTMHRNAINFLYNPCHITLWCLEVVPLVYARVDLTYILVSLAHHEEHYTTSFHFRHKWGIKITMMPSRWICQVPTMYFTIGCNDGPYLPLLKVALEQVARTLQIAYSTNRFYFF